MQNSWNNNWYSDKAWFSHKNDLPKKMTIKIKVEQFEIKYWLK